MSLSALLAAMILAAPARADAEEIKSLEQKVGSWAVLKALGLSKEQAQQLWPLVLQARTLADSYESSLRGIQARQLEAFARFREEDMRGEGLSRKVEAAAGRADHEEKMVRKRYYDRLAALEKRAAALLDEEQRESVASFEGLSRVLLDRLSGKVKPLAGPMGNIIRKIRRLPPREYAMKRDALRAELERAMHWTSAEESDLVDYMLRVNQAMDEIRALPVEKVATKAPKILEGIRPKAEVTRIHEELGVIYGEKYGTVGPLGKFLASSGTRALMSGAFDLKDEGASVRSGEKKRVELPKDAEERLRRLRQEINLLNLVNGMYFSRHQMEHLIEASRKMGGREEAGARAVRTARAYAAALRDVWSLIGSAKPIPVPLLRHTLRLAAEYRAPSGMGTGRTVDVGRLMQGVDEILFDAQREVLADYAPCLIPPKNLKNPVRVGQANDNSVLVGQLERFRRIPEHLWRARKKVIVDDALGQIERHGGRLPEKERGERKEWLAGFLDKIRKMDGADFELEKETLASEMEKLDRAHTLKKRLREISGEDELVMGKIRAFLLDPCLARLLEERLTLIAANKKMKVVNLDEVSPAPSCKDGGCAVKD